MITRSVVPADRPAPLPEQFSVIVPACRAAGYIGPTLAAVAVQTRLPAEVLVYEDGRDDDLAARVQAFAATVPFAVRLLGSPHNQGVSRARNCLLAEARGEFAAFLDADDVWEADHLATAAAALTGGADVCFSGVTFIDGQGRPMAGRGEPSARDLADIARAMFRYNFIQCTSTLSLRRAWLDRVAGFDPKLSHGEDLDLWLRLLAAGAQFRYTGQCSCRYRKHPTSAMADTLRMVERMGVFYEKQLGNSILPPGECRRALIRNRRVHVRLQWRRDPAKAAGALARLVRLQPWNPLHAVGWAVARLRATYDQPASL